MDFSKITGNRIITLILLASFSSPTAAFAHGGDHGRDNERDRDRSDRDDQREAQDYLHSFNKYWSWGHSRQTGQPHFVFLSSPSAHGVAGKDLARAPWLLVVDGKGRPHPAALKDLAIKGYADRACTIAAPATLRGKASEVLARMGIAAFKSVVDTTAGIRYFKISARGVLPACSSAVTIAASAAHHLMELGGNNQSGEVGTLLAAPARVKVVDAFGNAVSGIGISFAASAGGGAAFPGLASSDANGVASAALRLGPSAGMHSWIASRSSGILTGTPASIGFTARATASSVPVPPVPTITKLALSGPTSQVAGACSSAFTVKTVNESGAAVNQGGALSVTVAGIGSGELYSDVACTASATSITIPAGSNSAAFFIKDTLVESLSVVATAQSTGASAAVGTSVLAAAPSRIAITAGDHQTAAVGAVLSVQPQVQVTDDYGNLVSGAGLSFTVGLGGGSVSPALTSTDTGGLASTSLTLGQLAGQNTLIVSGSASGATAWAQPANPPSVTFTETATADAPATLAFSGPNQLQAGVCSSAFTVSLSDAFGNAAPASSTLSLGLSGQGHGSFYADAACSQAVSAAVIPAGSASHTLYFSNPSVESLTLAISGASAGLADKAISSSVTPAAADHLVLVAGDAQSAVVGQSLAIAPQVRVVDAFGNPIAGYPVSFAVTSGGGAVSAASSITASNGVASVGFTLGTAPGLNTLSATGASLPGAPSSINFSASASADAPSKLAFSGPVAEIAGTCSGAFTVSQQDAFGNPSIAQSQIDLAGGGSGLFYADSTCSGAAQSSIVLAAGTSSATFYFRDELAENLILVVSSQGLAGSLLPFTVQVGWATQLLLVQGDTQSAITGQTVAVDPTVRATDDFGNAVAEVAVSFAASAGNGSVSAASVLTDATGLASVQYTLGLVAGPNQLTASIGSGATVSFTATALSKAPVALLLSGPASLVAGTCSAAYTAQLLDDTQAPASRSSDTIIALDGAAAGAFYLDAGCSQASNELIIAAGQSSAQVYFLDTAAESVALSIQSAGLASSGVNATISPASVSQLVYAVMPPASATQDAAFGAQPVLRALDAFGNLVNDFGAAVSLSAFSDPACAVESDGSLSADSNPVSASSGQVAFSGLKFDSPGVIYVGATSAGLPSACSAAVTVYASLTLAAGTAHTCALKDGNVKCWGFGTAGTLGNGTRVNASTPQQVSGLVQGAIVLGAGGQHTCAATSTGLSCWGLNASGQLGDGTQNNSDVPVAVSGIGAGVIQIVGGDSHTCALSDGNVHCWGDNVYGQLGNGTNIGSTTATLVQGLPSRVRSIAAASVATCAVLVDASAYCWGYNSFGQLGDGTTQNRNLPVRVQGLGSIKTIAPGVDHTCALVSDQVYCWGRNSFGQLGSGDLSNSTAPRLVQGVANGVTRLLSGGQNFNCVIVTGGSIQCWGQNTRGQLGDNKVSGTQSTLPVQVSGLTSGMTALHAGYIHACASDGSGIKCWGWGSSGQLGNGASLQSSVPVSVIGY